MLIRVCVWERDPPSLSSALWSACPVFLIPFLGPLQPTGLCVSVIDWVEKLMGSPSFLCTKVKHIQAHSHPFIWLLSFLHYFSHCHIWHPCLNIGWYSIIALSLFFFFFFLPFDLLRVCLESSLIQLANRGRVCVSIITCCQENGWLLNWWGFRQRHKVIGC